MRQQTFIVSVHALERATERLAREWLFSKRGDETVATWLYRVATLASQRIHSRDLRANVGHVWFSFRFHQGELILTSVWANKEADEKPFYVELGVVPPQKVKNFKVA